MEMMKLILTLTLVLVGLVACDIIDYQRHHSIGYYYQPQYHPMYIPQYHCHHDYYTLRYYCHRH